MKILLFFAFLFPPFFAFAAGSDVEVLPGLDEIKAQTPGADGSLQRPDAQKIMSELSELLHLSSKQEDRISRAINKKTREFDGNMEDYEENSAQEKKWRFKMDANMSAMKKIGEELPDVVRDFLDDEQRQAYDDFLAARSKPAPAAVEAPAAGQKAAKPAKKRRLIRRKKGAAVGAAPAEGGPAGVRPAKKRRLIRRKKAAAPPASEQEPAADLDDTGPAGAIPTGQEAQEEEEEAGAYP